MMTNAMQAGQIHDVIVFRRSFKNGEPEYVPEKAVLFSVNAEDGTGVAEYSGNAVLFDLDTLKVLYWFSKEPTGEWVVIND